MTLEEAIAQAVDDTTYFSTTPDLGGIIEGTKESLSLFTRRLTNKTLYLKIDRITKDIDRIINLTIYGTIIRSRNEP